MSYFDLGLVFGQLSLWRPVKPIVLETALSCVFLSKLSYLHSYPEQGLIPRYTGSQSPIGTRQGWSHSPVNSVWLSGGEECAERAEQLGSPAAESPAPGWGGVVSLWPNKSSFSFVLSGTAGGGQLFMRHPRLISLTLVFSSEK